MGNIKKYILETETGEDMHVETSADIVLYGDSNVEKALNSINKVIDELPDKLKEIAYEEVTKIFEGSQELAEKVQAVYEWFETHAPESTDIIKIMGDLQETIDSHTDKFQTIENRLNALDLSVVTNTERDIWNSKSSIKMDGKNINLSFRPIGSVES